MFGLLKKKKPQVFEHWYVLLPDFQSSTTEYYEKVQERLTSMEVPGLDVSESRLGSSPDHPVSIFYAIAGGDESRL